MECFKHQSKQAVGICRSCNKATCRDCAIIFPKGLACSEECLHDAKELVEMNERGKKLYGIGEGNARKISPNVMVWLLLSAAMWVLTLISYLGKTDIDYGSMAMAIVFSVITLIIFRSSKRTGLQC